jgi:putative restriction endonuclease
MGFENNGALILSPVAHRPSVERMGVETKEIVKVGAFTTGQKGFLEFHRTSVLLKAAR